jgi:hypothetical protein
MAEQGGYRKPTMPAAISGPGKFSQRTDGGPGETIKQAQRYVTGLEQGEGKAFNEEVVNAAPMSAAGGPMSGGAPAPSAGGGLPFNFPQAIPLDAPTQRPDEPITAGMPFGEGPNFLSSTGNAAGIIDQEDEESARALLAYLESIAGRVKSASVNNTIRRLRAGL